MRIAVSRAPGQERAVTPLELLFDLVYVFAIGETAELLVEHVTLRAGLETLVITLAVVYAWYMTSWGLNWLEPDRMAVRLLLIGLMFASLLMSVGIGEAFGDRAWLFVTGYLLAQIGRTAFLIVALRGRPVGEHFVNALVWEVAGGVLWIAGALAHDDVRLLLWAVAVVLAHAGAIVLHWLPGRGQRISLDHSEIAGAHLLERFRLFFLIALGETILTMGSAFTGEPFAVDRLAALALGFVTTVALWWCYFEGGERVGERAVESAEDGGGIGWLGTWTLTLIVIAIIAIAVGDELAIGHPGDAATLGFTILVFGGPLLFLVAQSLFLRVVTGRVPPSRLLAIAALVVLAVATAWAPMIVGNLAAAAVLVAVAAASLRDADQDGSEADSALSASA